MPYNERKVFKMDKIYIVIFITRDGSFFSSNETTSEIHKIFRTKQKAKDWILNEWGLEVDENDKVKFNVKEYSKTDVDYEQYIIEEYDLED